MFNFVKHISSPLRSQKRNNYSTLQWISGSLWLLSANRLRSESGVKSTFLSQKFKKQTLSLAPGVYSSGSSRLSPQLSPRELPSSSSCGHLGNCSFWYFRLGLIFFCPEGFRLVWTLVGMQKIICILRLSFWFLACQVVCTVIDLWDWLQYGSWYRGCRDGHIQISRHISDQQFSVG